MRRYVASNPQYADSTAYAGKFRQLHGRALATVRAKVQQVMRHASEQVCCALSLHMHLLHAMRLLNDIASSACACLVLMLHCQVSHVGLGMHRFRRQL